jgi:ATP-dependent Clp protease ATP-binding subunit ClpA
MESLKEHFRPEFINRLDEIVIFDILSPEAIRNIVEIELKKVKERLTDKEITLEFTESALQYLAKEGYNPQYGARPLKRVIQNKILNEIATLIIDQSIQKGGQIKVDFNPKAGPHKIDGTRAGEFVFDVKKGKKGSIVKESLISVA